MASLATLDDLLGDFAKDDAAKGELAIVVQTLAEACREIADLIAAGPLAGDLGAARGSNEAGDTQKELDVLANDILIERLRAAPVAHIASEELDAPLATGVPGATLCVAMDPLDGSSNIDTNVSIGTIFSITRAPEDAAGSPVDVFLQPGSAQLAAGYVIYGPQTALVLSLGEGTQILTLDRDAGTFHLTQADVQVEASAREFAINTSNYRHWDEGIRQYIDECLDGAEGPREKNFNTRWVASLVAECHRILSRGGVFLYPGDARAGYEQGRLRLLYEANPIALLIEQAGGSAGTGEQRILDVVPSEIHERVPLIFGSADEVARIEHCCEGLSASRASALFSSRGQART